MISTFSQFRHEFATTATLGVDGYEPWPVANIGLNGFAPTWSGIGKFPFSGPLTGLLMYLSLDNYAVGPLAYRSYLSQRTDDASARYLTIAEAPTASGSWIIQPSPLAVSTFDIALSGGVYHVQTEEQAVGLFRDVVLYVQRLSDDAIAVLDFLPRIVGSYS